ncbi:MAG: hypothetical protein GX421_08025 [Caldisericales bacterium]|nr:hypothetical protein [Caldisericales bacterium]
MKHSKRLSERIDEDNQKKELCEKLIENRLIIEATENSQTKQEENLVAQNFIETKYEKFHLVNLRNEFYLGKQKDKIKKTCFHSSA